MSSTDIDSDLGRARALRLHLDLARLDYLRLLRRLAETLTAVEISDRTGSSPSHVSAALAEAADIAEPVAGFSGASPYEIAQRFADGQIPREQLVDELARWDYPLEQGTHDDFDALVVSVPGSFDEVTDAAGHGLIDGATYDEILNAAADRSS
ncbi:hypothetical protein HD599_003025 [Conyzicola lurida]|uniref:Uncharacterized protein n=1 Tax=Conyzicola lurida TaxID=1172621 RepID=A0A841ARY0_9MICO|nr:hypothetical protein [Conyzicola lurida]MBB5844702.1 hypothetical protein [Conyzicola lurida]